MARWALILAREGRWQPVIKLTAGYLDRHMKQCRAEGITVILPALESPLSSSPEAGLSSTTSESLRSRLRQNRILRGVVGLYRDLPSVRGTISLYRQIQKRRSETRAAIREHDIDLALLPESSPVAGAEACIAASREESVPVVTAPIEKQSAAHQAENYLYDRELRSGRPVNALLRGLYPRWALHHKRRRIMRAPPELILAQELAGVAPPHPWRTVGNGENVIAVDSVSTLEHYASEGVERGLLRVVGRPEHDIMAETLKEASSRRVELYSRLGLRPGRPMILSPLVPDHYVSGRPECDFQDYRELVRFWVDSLASVTSHNVVISLHPGHSYRQSDDAWSFLERPGVRIAPDDLPELVPLCDFYVAAGYSTTTQWAIACAKPVINYDVYRYAMPIYDATPGVITVREQKDFLSALTRLAGDREYYADVAASQAESAPHWGVLDGKAAARMADLFDDLAAGRAKTGLAESD